MDLSTFASDPPIQPQNVDKNKKNVVFWVFSSFGTKKFLQLFTSKNFLTSSIFGLLFKILGHGGSLKCKIGGKPTSIFVASSFYDVFEPMSVDC